MAITSQWRIMLETCSLCGRKKELNASHIIPKFVGKWLKTTSATGFMSSVKEPRQRIQDLPTRSLLCSDCEQRFSRLETYFSNQIFFPFHKKKIQFFEYDKRLELFVVSLSWRTLKTSYDHWKKEEPHLSPFVDKAEEDWRNFLLGKRQEIEPYENHILFLDYIDKGANIPARFQWYTLRAIDATLAGNKNRIFAYTKFPWMVFVTSIHPTVMRGWKGTAVEQNGTILTPQRMEDGMFGQFLVGRALIVLGESSSQTPEWRKQRFIKTIARDPRRFLESGTLETMIAENDRERMEKMKDMPNLVKELVKVIIDAVYEPNRSKSENRYSRLQARWVADAISNLTAEEALALDTLISSTIKEAKILQSDAQTTLEARGIWVTFMVNPSSTKEYQRNKIATEIDRLKKKREPRVIPLAVFSMNASDDGVSFESGFWIDRIATTKPKSTSTT